jgi:general secretion pathway protein A
LQDRFQKADSSYQQIITGGRYNWAIREQVFLFQNRHGINADGVVGRQTIMKLNELTDPSIPRLINPQADAEVD